LTQNLIDPSFALHWRTSRFVFFEVNDLPPGRGRSQGRDRLTYPGRGLVMRLRKGEEMVILERLRGHTCHFLR
jgi:hypothetical protein